VERTPFLVCNYVSFWSIYQAVVAYQSALK